MDDLPPSQPVDKEFEREKWQKEVQLREREIAVKESEARIKNLEAAIKDREQELKARELQLKVIELKRSRFANPLFLAILGATVAATGTAIGAGIAAWSQVSQEQTRSIAQQDIERFKADATLVLEVIKTNNDTQKAKDNLEFLVGTHLISNPERRSEIAAYLKGQGPVASLTAAAPAPAPVSNQNVGIKCTMPVTTDIPKVAAEIEKRWNANASYSNVHVNNGPDSTTIIADLRLPVYATLLRNAALKTTAVMSRTSSAVNVTITVELPGIPQLFLAVFSTSLLDKAAAEFSKEFEGIVGSKVVCDSL